MKEVVIAGYLRTAQSRSRPNDPGRDWFCNIRADELLAGLLPEVIKSAGVTPDEIDDFLVGCATGVNEQWMFGGRYPIFLANLPETISAKFIDQQCGSAMAGIQIGYMEIAMDFADIVLVGGMEHMTRVPMGDALVDKDQAVRENATVDGMAVLNPAFKEDGAITAGNASPLNAGATSMVLVSKDTAREKGIRPLATIRSIGFAGVDPTIMGHGPVPASRKALKKAGLDAADIDYWEINEAFSIVALNCIKELVIDPDRVNVMGGGIAIGHPLGATGIRLTGTLARILQARGGQYGCANACIGGGQGVAIIIENEPYDWNAGT